MRRPWRSWRRWWTSSCSSPPSPRSRRATPDVTPPPSDAIAQRRAELERRLAALSPEKRAQLERARANGAGEPAVRRGGIVPREPGTPVPMSYAQELLWLLDRASPGMHGYNVPRTARLRGPLDVAALQAALDGIVARHEVLRSTFDLVDDEPRQIVHAPA